VLFGVIGVIDFLKALQFPADQVEPFHHLFQELMDAGDGKRPSKLLTVRKKNKNAEQGDTFWGLRAALWSAVKIRSEMDDTRNTKNPIACAAEKLATEYPKTRRAYNALRRGQDAESFADPRGYVEALTNKLITLDDTIEDRSYPPDSCVPAFSSFVENAIKGDLSDLQQPGREERLRRMCLAMLSVADRYLDRFS
jgi:hypothetical protein